MPVRVLIVDTKPLRSQALERALVQAGFEVAAVLGSEAELYGQVDTLAPDVIVIDGEFPGRDTLEDLSSLGKRYPKPMVMLTDTVDPQLTLAAARAGVSAYAVEAVSAPVLRSLIDVSIAHFRTHSALRSELNKTQQTLAARKLIDRAKCSLMERRGLGEEAAYQRLRKMAMDRRMSLTDVARELLGADKS